MDEPSMRALAEAFLLEATFSARNVIYAQRAVQDGQPQTARLFRALARAQEIHANKALMLLRGKAETTEENLAQTLEDVEDAARLFKALAGDAVGAARGFLEQFGRTAKSHASLIGQMREDSSQIYQVCSVCGYLCAGEPPAPCPVCKAIQDNFEAVD